MEAREGVVPSRLRTLPSWLVNQTAVPANSLVSAAFASAGARRYHYKILAALDEYGSASQVELGRRCGIDRSDMVAAINELSDGGYVERTPDPADRRRNVVTLTDGGRRHLGELDRLVREAQDELLGPLAASERAQLVDLLTRVVDHHAS